MKVSVMGLLPSQQRFLGVGDFPNLDVRFIGSDAGRSSAADQQLTGADRILVMANFVSHSLTEKLDRKKTTLIHGGLTKVKTALAGLNAASISTRLARKPVIIDVPDHEEDNDMANTKKKAEQTDFKTPMLAAKEGDVLTFKRPPKTTMLQWEQRVGAVRSYYKNHHGVHTDLEIKDGIASFLITKLTGKPPTKHEIAKAQELLEQRRLVQAAERAASKLAAPAEVPAPRVAMPVEVSMTSVMDREFWQKVFMQSMAASPGVPVSFHVQQANLAMDEMRKALGG